MIDMSCVYQRPSTDRLISIFIISYSSFSLFVYSNRIPSWTA